MDLLFTGLFILLLVLFIDAIRGTALTLWLARIFKRPVVQVFFPEGKVEYILLKKKDEYARGFILQKYNTAYTRTPGSIYLLDGKIPVYVVYLPFGKTVHPAWIKMQAVAMKLAGVKHVRELFEGIQKLEPEYAAAVEFLESIDPKKKNLTGEEKREIERAQAIVERYNRFKHALSIIEQINDSLAPQVLEELVLDSDASANAQMIKDAETRERTHLLEYIKNLGIVGQIAVLIGIVIIGIIIVWALVHGGGPNVIEAGTKAAQHVAGAGQKVVEANVVKV